MIIRCAKHNKILKQDTSKINFPRTEELTIYVHPCRDCIIDQSILDVKYGQHNLLEELKIWIEQHNVC